MMAVEIKFFENKFITRISEILFLGRMTIFRKLRVWLMVDAERHLSCERKLLVSDFFGQLSCTE
jgi:hypothetical protein